MRKIKVTVKIHKVYEEEIEISDENYNRFINDAIDERDLPGVDLDDLFVKCMTFPNSDKSGYHVQDDEGNVLVDWD